MRLTTALVAALVVVLLAGVGSAIAISHQLRRIAAASGQVGSSVSASHRAAGGGTSQSPVPARPPGGEITAPRATGTGGPHLPTPAGTVSPTAGTSTNPAGPSTNLTVQLSSAAQRNPEANRVQAVLQRFFDAVNQHDFLAWTDAVTPALSRSQTGARWQQAYASTVDSSIVVTSIATDPLVATVGFTSEQDASLAPADLPVGCIHWKLSYRLTVSADSADQRGGLVDGSFDAVKVAC